MGEAEATLMFVQYKYIDIREKTVLVGGCVNKYVTHSEHMYLHVHAHACVCVCVCVREREREYLWGIYNCTKMVDRKHSQIWNAAETLQTILNISFNY